MLFLCSLSWDLSAGVTAHPAVLSNPACCAQRMHRFTFGALAFSAFFKISFRPCVSGCSRFLTSSDGWRPMAMIAVSHACANSMLRERLWMVHALTARACPCWHCGRDSPSRRHESPVLLPSSPPLLIVEPRIWLVEASSSPQTSQHAMCR